MLSRIAVRTASAARRAAPVVSRVSMQPALSASSAAALSSSSPLRQASGSSSPSAASTSAASASASASSSSSPVLSSLELSELTAVSPIDGRYGKVTRPLRGVFSEAALIWARIRVEVAWLRHLSQHADVPEVPHFSARALERLEELSRPSLSAAQRVKAIESTTRHDLKAVEYYLKEQFSGDAELESVAEFLHFAATSEDVNNLSYALMMADARQHVLLPAMDAVIDKLRAMAHAHADEPMLGRTHGQTASPTTVGKELANFVVRLREQRDKFARVAIRGKFNGAVGNFNAHLAAYPHLDWLSVSQQFVEQQLGAGLVWQAYSTQIECHDWISEVCDHVARFNTVMLDLDRDMWGYISQGYFSQASVAGEIGSSTMPHKINPIDFENSEGNAGVANALLHHFSTKLPISRFQRDLTDSTVLRSLGVAFAHTLLATHSLRLGLSKVQPNRERLQSDLDGAWEVLAEPVQTVLRRYGVKNPYEKLKELTRGKRVTHDTMRAFIDSIEGIPREEKERLMHLTPASYIGNAAEMARKV